jgi:leader peptidase (prepilin peptidase) / N-methyltransferase
MAADAVATRAVPAPRPVEVRPRTWRVRPAVLVLAAVVAAAAPVRLGLTPYAVMAAGGLAVLVVLSAIDLQARILPNKILLPAMGAVLAGQVVFYPERVVEVLAAALLAGAVMLAPRLVNPAAMGMGDVKLAVFLGVLLGAKVLPALMLGFIATAPVLAVLLVRRGRAARQTALPLGPFLALGAAILLLA